MVHGWQFYPKTKDSGENGLSFFAYVVLYLGAIAVVCFLSFVAMQTVPQGGRHVPMCTSSAQGTVSIELLKQEGKGQGTSFKRMTWP